MGSQVVILLNDVSQENIDKQNQVLNNLGIDEGIHFYSEKDVKLEYDWFKTNKNEFPDHLIPHDKIKSFDDFKQYWNTENLGKTFCPEFGSLKFDIAYDRTEQDQIDLITEYLITNISLIKKGEGSFDSFVNMTKLDDDLKESLLSLYKENKLKKLPVKDRYIPDLQSGIMLAKSYSPNPFWLVYGNVDEPNFLKTRIYVDDVNNNIYRDEKGYGYLLMPTMPLDANLKWFINIYSIAFDMGLREEANYVLSNLYGVLINNDNDIVDQLNDYYTHDELKTRFKEMFFNLKSIHGYNYFNGFVWRRDSQEFIAYNSNHLNLKNKCIMLTLLLKAMNVTENWDEYLGIDQKTGELV